MKEVFVLLKKSDIIPGIFSAGIGALVLLYIYLNPKMVIFIEKNEGALGPGFFSFVCGVCLVGFGIILAIRGIKQRGTVDYFEMTDSKKENLVVAGLLALLCGIMLAAWKLSGMFFACLPIYALAVNKLFKRSTKFALIFTVVVTGFIYVLFRVCFSISFRA